MILGNPALRELARMKLRGLVRRQVRRMKSLSGLFFIVVGTLLMFAWLASILFTPHMARGVPWEGELLRSTVQFGFLFFCVISFATALSIRGVYFPKQEVERLFSSPVTRSDLVRFRMQVDLARTLLGAAVLGVLTHRRMPVPIYGFFGAFVSVLTLSIVRQMASLLFGDAHGRIGRFLAKHDLGFVRVVLGILAWLAIMLLIFGESLIGEVGGFARGKSPKEIAELALLNPVAQVVLAPFRPWAEMMTARTAGAFFGWTAACVVIGLGLYELTARLPIDFRELSLQTSEEIARRLRNMRRGGRLTGGKISEAAAGRRVPWLFGTGAFGAVAWIKTAAMLRKARGTLLVSVFVVGFVTVVLSFAMSDVTARDADKAAVVGSIMIAVLGMWYLSGGLRFDFRADLDRMETIKSWPLGPARLFLATLLPETALIWVVLSVAIVTRALLLHLFDPLILLVIGLLPFLTLAWLAVDNAVFLLAPVRFVPGQEGTLHHTGRALVMVFVRLLLFLASSVVVGVPAAAVYFLCAHLELETWATTAAVTGVGVLMLVAVDAVLVYFGGRMLRRFDVARDRA